HPTARSAQPDARLTPPDTTSGDTRHTSAFFVEQASELPETTGSVGRALVLVLAVCAGLDVGGAAAATEWLAAIVSRHVAPVARRQHAAKIGRQRVNEPLA